MIFSQINDLNFKSIREILDLAKTIQSEGAKNALASQGITYCSLFFENSTRTKSSFELAALNLGHRLLPFDVQKSSVNKGENLYFTLRTLGNLGVSLVAVRSSESKSLEVLKNEIYPLPPMIVINAGDGVNEHPSQALGDLFTIQELGLLKAKKCVAIVGDIAHSRVAHSLMQLLPLFELEVILSGPEKLQEFGGKCEVVKNSHDAFERADIIYLLRVQKERHNFSKLMTDHDYLHSFGLSWEKYQKLPKAPYIFHPGPANIGVEIDTQTIFSPHYRGDDQVRFGLIMRMALMQYLYSNYMTFPIKEGRGDAQG